MKLGNTDGTNADGTQFMFVVTIKRNKETIKETQLNSLTKI